MYAQTGKFRDIVELGKGGMGDVFLTVAPGLAGFNKLLVVKRLKPSLASDPEFLRMFLGEARLAARLNHPNIVHTYEVGFDGARHYIAMEYLEGQSLQRLIRRAAINGGLPFEMQLRVLADVLAGLHYAHELTDYDGTPLAIVHRDVSPANIFVLYDGQAKLVDFGIAKSANSGETKAGIFKGKIQYVSPEQYTGGAIDRRADIYSAGVVLWEAITQRRMWQDVGDLTVVHRVAAGDVPPPRTVNPQVPAALEAICMKALSVRKEDRYPTAAALQTEIEEFLAESGSRVSARQVGALAARTFEDERAHVKILIEDQLRLVRDAPDPQSLVPTVTVQQDTGSRPLPPEPSVTAAAPSLPPAFANVRSRRRNAALGVGGALALLMTVLVVWSSSSSAPEKVQASAPTAIDPAAPSATAPAPPAAPAAPPVNATPRIKLIFETVPKNARISVDDAFLPPNEDTAEFPQDRTLHKVKVEAPGFRGRTEWVRFDSDDVTLQIGLDASAKKGRKAETKEGREGPPSSPSPEAASTPTVAPAGAPPQQGVIHEIETAAPRRRSSAVPLDTADPWKK